MKAVLIALICIGVVGAGYLLYVMHKVLPSGAAGSRSPLMQLQLPVTASDLNIVSGPGAAATRAIFLAGHRLEMVFIAIFTSISVLSGLLIARGAIRPVGTRAKIGIAFAIVAGLVRENLTIDAVMSALAVPPPTPAHVMQILWASWPKWVLLGVTQSVLVSAALLRIRAERKPGIACKIRYVFLVATPTAAALLLLFMHRFGVWTLYHDDALVGIIGFWMLLLVPGLAIYSACRRSKAAPALPSPSAASITS